MFIQYVVEENKSMDFIGMSTFQGSGQCTIYRRGDVRYEFENITSKLNEFHPICGAVHVTLRDRTRTGKDMGHVVVAETKRSSEE